MNIDQIIDGLIGREGGYSNDPADTGGETMWGVTKTTARANGYEGKMRDMPRATAERIYRDRYIVKPSFDRIAQIDAAIGVELVDSGVNMGPTVAAKFLQRALNAFNRKGADYADVLVDGAAGIRTRTALQAYLARRGALGSRVLVATLNALQGEHYIALCEARPENEKFAFGWLANRVAA